MLHLKIFSEIFLENISLTGGQLELDSRDVITFQKIADMIWQIFQHFTEFLKRLQSA